ncbi:unnamed protein product [Hyaloperonospora brassicae]|uniref:SUI1 domain-containing protein n=1 Tax=Hyaloperonospora brassicae TaxID=162125 RepID=A0AAV0UBG0_HYABA|nr:unnamed protein product [Hyaloperonospora brassicae]
MFAKPSKVSGNVLLKNKDVRTLRHDVATCFASSIDGPDDPNLKRVLPPKAVVQKVRFQAPSRVVVYTAEANKVPVLFDMTGKGEWGFSVYALWQSPALLPRLMVHAPVSTFVLRGADVMLPGVVFPSPEALQTLRKGELRAVYVEGNPHAIAVGEMLVDAADVERSGKEGRALRLWHVVGDALWQMGPQTLPNEGFLGDHVVSIGQKEQLEETEEEEERGGDASGTTESGASLEDEVQGKDTKKEEEEVTKEQMDRYYVEALLQALRTSRVREKDLPMLASSFHANVLLPCRRAGVTLNIKHSSFKKLSVYLKGMETHELLTVVDNAGVVSITTISRRHRDVLSHEAYETVEDAQQKEQATADKAAGLHDFTPGQSTPEIEESFGLSPALKTLFLPILPVATIDQPVQKYYSRMEVRDLVTQYVESQGLVDTENRKFVRLNGPLTDALYGKKAPAGGYKERLARQEICNLLLSKCTHYHRIRLFPTHAAKFRGGSFRPIMIVAKKLKGRNNTTVTSIAFYQQFGIDGAAFAKEVQKKWGCSAALRPSEDKSMCEEIQIHGQMVNEVLEHLGTKYRINAKYCDVSYGKDVKAKKKK